MFGLIKLVASVIIISAAAYFALGYFGYEVNRNYFKESKETCRERLKECSSSLVHQGIDNAECDLVCVDPKLIIEKK